MEQWGMIIDPSVDDVMSAENAKRQFIKVKGMINAHFAERMKTSEGLELLRIEIAAMQGRHPSEVKFEGELP